MPSLINSFSRLGCGIRPTVHGDPFHAFLNAEPVSVRPPGSKRHCCSAACPLEPEPPDVFPCRAFSASSFLSDFVFCPRFPAKIMAFSVFSKSGACCPSLSPLLRSFPESVFHPPHGPFRLAQNGIFVSTSSGQLTHSGNQGRETNTLVVTA